MKEPELSKPLVNILNWLLNVFSVQKRWKRTSFSRGHITTKYVPAQFPIYYKDIQLHKPDVTLFQIKNNEKYLQEIGLNIMITATSEVDFTGEHIEHDKYKRTGEDMREIGYLAYEDKEEVLEAIQNLQQKIGINKKIITTKNKKDFSKIVLKIDTIKCLVLREENNTSLPFRKPSVKNKRFKMLVKITRSKHPILAEEFEKSASYISSEVREINDRLKKKLTLVDDIIINDQTAKEGYSLNRNDYKIIFI
jgi:hypothetical protein